MKNIHLAYPNRIDAATLSGGSWLATLPLDNLKNRRISKLARSTDATLASTQFVIDFGRARQIDCIGLVAHNLSAGSKARIKANSTNSFATPAFDSGWMDVWPGGFLPEDALEWEDDNFWLGTISQEAVAGYQTPYVWYADASLSYQYWQVEIDDATNDDGYIHIGRLFTGPVFVPTYNMSWGASLVVDDATTFETSLSGEEFFDTRQRFRIQTFALDFLTEAEAYQQVMDMQRLLGTSGEVLINGDPDDVTNRPRRSFLSRLQNIAPVVHEAHGIYSCQFTLREVL